MCGSGYSFSSVLAFSLINNLVTWFVVSILLTYVLMKYSDIVLNLIKDYENEEWVVER